MEVQMHHPQDTGLHMGEGHGQVHDEGEQHHHKKSVLKKVKAKAKKIKDTLKHGLGHDHEHEHEHEHHHDEEEETDDEEMEEGGEVHGGSYAIRSKTIPKEDILGKQTGNLENPKSPKEDRYDAKMKDEEVHKPVLERQDEYARPPSVGDTHFPQERQRPQAVEEKTHETKGNDHKGTVLEPYPPHYRGDMHDPVTATEKHRREDIDHEITGFEPYDAPHSREEMHRPPPAAEALRTKGIDPFTRHRKLEEQGLQGHKIGAPAGVEEDPHAPKYSLANPNDSNYQSKVTDPTGTNNEEAGISQIVQSFEKICVDDAPETIPDQGTWKLGGIEGTGDTNLDQGIEHSKYTGSHDQFAPQQAAADFPSVPKDTESLPKSMDPSNPQDSPQDTLTGKHGSYTEKISSATAVIADKAVAAKNVVASKLGYGGTAEESMESSSLDASGHEKGKPITTSATELAQKAATTVTEKLAPVYEKVAGAGSMVMAKVQGAAAGATGHADTEHEGNAITTNKGVSMKEYLAEKFKPGEEDKALSEVISGSLSRQTEKTEETGETKPMGEVTVSEEVERNLGPIEDAKKENGEGIMERLNNAVSTWLGKAGEVQTSSVVINAADSARDGGAVGGKGA